MHAERVPPTRTFAFMPPSSSLERLRLALLEPLLDALEAERHARGPLLLSIADELSALQLTSAAAFARDLCNAVEGGAISERDFGHSAKELHQIVRAAADLRLGVAVA